MMNKPRCWMASTHWKVFLGVGLLAVAASSADAALVNKYTFNDGTADDSVSGADGTLVDNTGIAQFVGGMLDLSANNGAGSNQDFSLPTTVGAYVNLPNNVFTQAVNNGTFGAVTLEVWFKVQQSREWAEVYSFGRSTAGEDIAGGAGDQDYVALIPHSGGGFNDYRAVTHSSAGAEGALIASPTPAPVNVMQHAVLVLDQNDTGGGTNLNGTAKLYVNNGAAISVGIEPFIDQMDDINNWIGRSQWPDQLFDGSIDELRIYDHALSAAEVTTSFTTGPDPAPLPKLIVNRATGAVSLSNASGSGIVIKGYSITSAAGSLNPATWTSIDAGNAFDSDGTWTAQSSTSSNLTESVTGGVQDGGTLAGGASRGVGTPWVKTPIEDLVFNFTLGNNQTGLGVVEYTGTAISRGDLNADGNVDAADWALFLPNAYTNISGETTIGAYRKGDLDGDKDNDYADFLLFKADFIAGSGAAAWTALVGAVPEPSTAVLFALSMCGLFGRGMRRSA